MSLFNSQQLLDTLEESVKETIARATHLQSINADLLRKVPAPGKWNVLQVLYHLNTYNDYYLPHLEQAIKKGRSLHLPASHTFKTGILGNYFVKMMQPGNNGIKNPMKAPKDHTPAEGFNNIAAISDFISGQQKLLQLIQEARSADLTKLSVPISISKFIKIRLGDTFRFLIAHQQRHFLQISNTLKMNNTPLRSPGVSAHAV